MEYSFGFSWKGFLIVFLPMIPNFFYFLFPNAMSSESTGINHLVLDIIEHGSQAIFIALLITLSRKNNVPMRSNYIIGMALFLLSYYILWVLLFMGNKNLIVLMCMAIFPVIYFVLSEMWLKNHPAILPTMIFGFVHVIITYKDFHGNT